MDAIHHPMKDAPKPIAPRDHSVDVSGLVFATGQRATDLEDEATPGPTGVETRTHKLADFAADHAPMIESHVFHRAIDRRPARTTIGLTHPVRDGIVEIDLIAVRPS